MNLKPSATNDIEEEKYRTFCLKSDINRARLGLLLVAIPIMGFIVNDYDLFGLSTEFLGLMALRVGLLAFTLLTLIYMKKVESYHTYDKAITAWGLTVVLVASYLNLTRPVSFIPDQTIVAVVYVFIIWLIIPGRFLYRLISSLIITLSEAAIIIVNVGSITLTALLSLCFVYAIAITSSWQFDLYRRQGFQEILNREKTEEALKESEEKFKGLVESTSDWIWQVDQNGVYVYASPKIEEILGYIPEEVLGKTPFDFMPKDEAERVSKIFAEIAAQKTPFTGLYNWNVHKNGSLALFETSGVPIVDNKGQLMGYRGIDRDVTERKKAEEALAKQQEELQTIIDSSPMWIFYKDRENRFLRVNKSFAESMGIPKEHLEGHSNFDIFPREQAEKFWNDDKQVMMSGKSMTDIIEQQQSKKGLLWVQTDKIPYRDAQGNIIGVIGFAHDITDAKKDREDMLQAKQRLEAHMNNSPLAVIEFDPQDRVIRFSEGAQRVFGWSKEEVIGKSIGELPWVYEEDVALVQQVSMDMLTGKQHRVVNFNRNYRKDGSVIYCEWYSSAIYDVNGKLVSVLSLVLDVTERKRMQDKIAKYTQNLEALVEERTKALKDSERLAAIGQTAGMVGHDLRNPLQSIIGEVFLAEDELKAFPESESKGNLQESVKAIADQINYMDKIVSDLQTFVKPVEAHKQIVSLKELITDVLAHTDIPKNIQTKIQAKNNLTANVDPQLMKRVLINLVNNSTQAMPNGGNLTITAHTAGGQVKVIVEDTGVGIPDEIKDKVFTPLFTTKSKGQGFGLAVCKRVIEAQGGNITFESQEGKGTKFVIELPLVH